MINTGVLVLLSFPFLATLSAGRPVEKLSESDKNARILTEEFTHDTPHSYQYKFETSNGIRQAEIGDFEETSLESGIMIKKGYYSYVGPDNVRYTVTYVADDNGYRPKLHRSHQLDPEELLKNSQAFDGIDDDRIGSNLLISLGGGNVG